MNVKDFSAFTADDLMQWKDMSQGWTPGKGGKDLIQSFKGFGAKGKQQQVPVWNNPIRGSSHGKGPDTQDDKNYSTLKQ